VQFNGKYFQCLQSHTSLIGWDPVSAPALWKSVSSCAAAAEESSSTQFSKYSVWLIPTIIVIIILFLATTIVLCKKKQRARGYSSELGVPELKLPTPDLRTEEVTLTQQGELPPPLEKSHSPTTTLTTSGRQMSPTSQQPLSPSQRPLSPSSGFHTEESSKIGGGGGPNELTILTTGQTKSTTTSPTRTSPLSPIPDSSTEIQSEGAARRRKSIQLLSPSAESEPVLPSLPSGWERRRDAASGQDFYYNTASGISQWEFPEAS
jgi:hypothetical protein